jgi:hypothetical protein
LITAFIFLVRLKKEERKIKQSKRKYGKQPSHTETGGMNGG